MSQGVRCVVFALPLALTVASTGCQARDTRDAEIPPGQTPAGGTVGGSSITYAPECDAAGNACSRLVTLAGETVEVLSAGQRVHQPTVGLDGDRVVYRADLPYPGPAVSAPDRLIARLDPNGWRLDSQTPTAVALSGDPGSRQENHRVSADFVFDPASSRVVARVELTGPA